MESGPEKRPSEHGSEEGHLRNPVYNADEFHKVHGKPLGLISLVVLVFYGVSGGPFGVEPAVAAGGPLIALLGFIVLPIAWSIPEAMITAELSTAFPEASGFVAWVTTAYGPFWGFMEGYLSWLSGVTDNALYPVLFLRYLVTLLGEDSVMAQGFYKWLFVGVTTVVLTYLNYRGLEIVGKSAIVICILSLLPFVIFVVVGAFQVDPSRWLDLPEGGLAGVQWTQYMNIMFWNLNYWDSAASFAGEVQDPGRTFPRAMLYAILLVVLSSFFPVLVGTGAFRGSYASWQAGYFVTVAEQVVGKWLSYFMIFGAAISNIGMFEGEMSSDSWCVAGMAERGMLPKVLARRNKYGTPPYAILLSAIGVLGLGWLSFEEIVELLNLVYCFAQTLEFAAFLQLRRKFPDLIRPYKIPLGLWGLYVMLFCPILFLIFIISLASVASLIFSCIAVVVGAGLYGLMETAKARGWWEFENQFADQEKMLVKLAEAQEQIIADELQEGGIAMKDIDEFPESLQQELSLLQHYDEEGNSFSADTQDLFVSNGYAHVPQEDDREEAWQANGITSYGALDRSRSV